MDADIEMVDPAVYDIVSTGMAIDFANLIHMFKGNVGRMAVALQAYCQQRSQNVIVIVCKIGFVNANMDDTPPISLFDSAIQLAMELSMKLSGGYVNVIRADISNPIMVKCLSVLRKRKLGQYVAATADVRHALDVLPAQVFDLMRSRDDVIVRALPLVWISRDKFTKDESNYTESALMDIDINQLTSMRELTTIVLNHFVVHMEVVEDMSTSTICLHDVMYNYDTCGTAHTVMLNVLDPSIIGRPQLQVTANMAPDRCADLFALRQAQRNGMGVIEMFV